MDTPVFYPVPQVKWEDVPYNDVTPTRKRVCLEQSRILILVDTPFQRIKRHIVIGEVKTRGGHTYISWLSRSWRDVPEGDLDRHYFEIPGPEVMEDRPYSYLQKIYRFEIGDLPLEDLLRYERPTNND